jgi:SAM-dependent methyltransferase
LRIVPPVIVLSGQLSRYPAAMPQDGLALPPRDLAARVGVPQEVDPLDFYLNEGRRLRGVIERLLPGGWDWEGKRALDFGCGAARVLRQFEPEAQIAELYGCDIDRTSVDWDLANLSPPFHFFHSELSPPLGLADGSLDLVWAMSVFTHIGDSWSAWLAELHRVLDAGGIVIASRRVGVPLRVVAARALGAGVRRARRRAPAAGARRRASDHPRLHRAPAPGGGHLPG